MVTKALPFLSFFFSFFLFFKSLNSSSNFLIRSSSVPAAPVLAQDPRKASRLALSAMHRIVGDVGAVPAAADVPERTLVLARPAVVLVGEHVPAMLLAAVYMGQHYPVARLRPHPVAHIVSGHATGVVSDQLGLVGRAQQAASNSRAGWSVFGVDRVVVFFGG